MERSPEPAAKGDPTAEQVLAWIAARGATAWFPSAQSQSTGIPREAFDQPLNELRDAELVRVVDWVRGAGQGYALTPDGEIALKPAPVVAVPIETVLVPDESRPSIIDLRPPIVTPALLLANLIWFFVGLVVATRLGVPLKVFLFEGDRPSLIRLGAVSAPELLQGDWWRLVTCCFVHGSIWHLVVNLFNLGMVGALAELLWGRWRVFFIYMIAGIAGSCLSMGLHPLDSTGRVTVTLVGASGAIWGLATSVVAWLLLFHKRLRPDLVQDLSRRLGFGFALSIAVSFLPGVSWEAHLGGAVAGFVAAILLNAVRLGRRVRRILAIVFVAMLPALCIGGLLLVIKYSANWEPLRNATVSTPPADPNPYLNAIQPELVKPVATEVVCLLGTSLRSRKPERIAVVRGKVAELWKSGIEASNRLASASGENAGKAKSFADTRVKSLSLLLGMIDANAIPAASEWKEWGERNREATRLWEDIAKK